MTTPGSLIAEVDRALGKAGFIARESRPARWWLELAGWPGDTLRAHVTDDWLRLTATVDRWPRALDDREPDEWVLLSLNARLPVPVRCALDPVTRQPNLCVDLRLDDERAISTRIRDAYGGLVAANEVLEKEELRSVNANDVAADGPPGSRASIDAVVPAQVSQVFAEAGWPLCARDDRQVVQIDVPPASTIALVHAGQDGGLGLDAALCSVGDSGVVRTAMARCLLAVTGTVRGVRASVQRASEEAFVGLEAGWVSTPVASDVRSGLTALAIVWKWCAREVRALQDPRVAEAYLTLFAKRCLDGANVRAAV